jgi:hypothetical protein
MFENEIKFISDFTLNKVKDLGSFITVEKLLSIDIHPSIKKYVEGEIDYLISEDRKKLIENSLFDYSGKEISNYFDLIGAEIKKTKKISFEDIKNIILQAVSFNANYVVRPKWSLSKLIFGNNKSVSVNELRLMLNYTYYYEYLNNVFLAYLSKKKILNISITEFELIVNKIDRELFTLHQSKLVDNALNAIADYFSIGGLNKSNLTVESVENFLKEKNLTELLFKLKRAYANTSKKKFDLEDIRKVLYSTLSVDSPFVEESQNGIIAATEKHFENPLKDEFINDEDYIENEDDSDADLKSVEDMDDFESQNNLENKVEDLTSETADDTSSISETESLSNSTESDEKLDSDLVIEDSSISELENNIASVKEVEKNNSAHSDNEDVAIEKELVNEEEVLAHLTEEIEKDEEIVILDEKEQEDLLNFYDNELEISIDDEIPSNKEKETEINIDPIAEVGDLDFEHELPIDEDIEKEIPLENLDFEKDLLGVDESKIEENTEEENKPQIIPKKSINDVFTYLSKKEIDRIIKNLFNSDSEDFANTVEKMSVCETYEEASEILENIFKYARIKPHSRDANALTNAVAKYFNMEK